MSLIDVAWNRLDAEAARLRDVHLRDLFAGDAGRFGALSVEAAGLFVDFSKEKIDRAGLDALLALAEAGGVAERREAMFSGVVVNPTENRAALHAALRDGAGDGVTVGDRDVMPTIRRTRARMLAFAEDVRTGRHAAHDGEGFTDVVNVGIGGSDIGPAMADRALAPFADGPRTHFISNVDGADMADTLAGLDLARTLVIVSSKSFATLETMMNARSVRARLEEVLGTGAGQHMAAVSIDLEATAAFGIAPERAFEVWDWVGGRFSIWSAIGLSLAIAVGSVHFRAFLAGAAAMDRHFRTAPPAKNLPLLLGLVGIWRRNAMGWPGLAVIPYDQRLARFPAFLQQLEMESNGKSVTIGGAPAPRATAPVVFGEPGANAQHSFFQLLHQGTDIVPVDFLVPRRPTAADPAHHETLVASALAQSAALAFGEASDDPHRVLAGDRPSTTILYDRLDPAALGALIALYEHKTFVQGVIWGINSFDQFGVELGKRLTKAVTPVLRGGDGTLDASTLGLARRIRGG